MRNDLLLIFIIMYKIVHFIGGRLPQVYRLLGEYVANFPSSVPPLSDIGVETASGSSIE